MSNHILTRLHSLLLILVVGMITSSSAFGNVTITIQNADSGTTGFNDPTPVAPVGGNDGTTIGQQRLNAFQFAASIWGRDPKQQSTYRYSCRVGSAIVHHQFRRAWFCGQFRYVQGFSKRSIS
jgi:hypothetical protein